jgi:hypothetical protein
VLESLPAEMRIRILLQLPDIPSLNALIRASPSYCASYLEAGRLKVLSNIALAAFQKFDYRLRPDALAAIRSARYLELHSGDREGVPDFLQQYGHARDEMACPTDLEWSSCGSAAEALDLYYLHEKIKMIADDYCQVIASESSQAKQTSSLSDLEQLRLYRAIYRYQIYCDFFGGKEPMRRSTTRIERSFLPTFPPWEIDEIASIWRYVDRRWVTLLRQISQIVPKGPRLWARNRETSPRSGWARILWKPVLRLLHGIILQIYGFDEYGWDGTFEYLRTCGDDSLLGKFYSFGVSGLDIHGDISN